MPSYRSSCSGTTICSCLGWSLIWRFSALVASNFSPSPTGSSWITAAASCNSNLYSINGPSSCCNLLSAPLLWKILSRWAEAEFFELIARLQGRSKPCTLYEESLSFADSSSGMASMSCISTRLIISMVSLRAREWLIDASKFTATWPKWLLAGQYCSTLKSYVWLILCACLTVGS